MKHKLKRSKAPKGRYFYPEIFMDTEFCKAEKEHWTGWFALRALHLGVMANADAYGRFEWDEERLATEIVRHSGMRRDKFHRLLHLLALGDSRGRPWLCRYNEQGEFDPQGCYGHVRTWSKWQHVHDREGSRVTVSCPCERASVQNEADTENNAFSESDNSSQVIEGIEGKVYMIAPFPDYPKERVVWHDGRWHSVEFEPELVTDWSGLEPVEK